MQQVTTNRIYNLHCKKDKICSICLDESRITTKDCFATICGHIFHEKCIKRHFAVVSQKCPICNHMQNNQYLIELEELDAREFNPQLVKQIENYDAIKILIENDIEVIVGYDMLIYAADMGKLNVVKFIIKQLEFDSLEFDKAFVAAASNNHVHIMEYLINYDASLDINSSNGKAIRIASKNGHFESVQCLIKYDAIISICDSDALRWASANGHLGIVGLLLKYGSIVSSNDFKALKSAIFNGHVDVVDALLKYISIDELIDEEFMYANDIYDAFYWAIRNGHSDCVELLLKYDIQLSTNNYIAFKYAIAYKQHDIIIMLCDDVSKYMCEFDFNVSLKIAILSKLYNIVEYLISSKEQYEIKTETLLCSSTNNNSDILELLLEKCINNEKLLVFSNAVKLGYVNDVKIFLKLGIDLQFSNSSGLTCNSSFVNNDNNTNNKAVYYASKYSRVSILKILLKNGFNIHALNYNSLRTAVKHNNLTVVKFLLEYGANLTIYNYEPLNIAISNNNYEMVEHILKQYKIQNLHINSDAALYNTLQEATTNTDMILLLLKNGADKHITDRIRIMIYSCSCSDCMMDVEYDSDSGVSDASTHESIVSDNIYTHTSECLELKKIIERYIY